jgi:hypothetical protein
MAIRDWDPFENLKKTNAPGYFVNEEGAIVNDDELAWMKYKAEREKSRMLVNLVRMVEQLNRRVEELEKQVNEATTSN